MIELLESYLLGLNEVKLFQLFKGTRRFKNLRRRSTDKYDNIDWYLPDEDLYIEGKCRKETYQSYLIEKKKYNRLIEHPNCWYVSSGGNGIFTWDLQEYIKRNKMYWSTDKYPKTSEFKDKTKIDKLCDYLNISEADYLTSELLLYPFDKNHYKL